MPPQIPHSHPAVAPFGVCSMQPSAECRRSERSGHSVADPFGDATKVRSSGRDGDRPFPRRGRSARVASVPLRDRFMSFQVPASLPWPCPKCGMNSGFTEENVPTNAFSRYHCSLCNNVWSVRTYLNRHFADEFVTGHAATAARAHALPAFSRLSQAAAHSLAAMTSSATGWLIAAVRFAPTDVNRLS